MEAIQIEDLFRKLKGQLQGIFGGAIPTHFLWIKSVHLKKVYAAFEKQKHRTVYNLNYVHLINDLGEGLGPDFNIFRRSNKISEKQLRVMLRANSILLTSIYLSVMQDMEQFSMQFKMDLGYFLRTFLRTVQTIYKVDCMENQQQFYELIDEHDRQQQEKNELFNQIMTAIRDTPENHLAEIWPFTEPQLRQLSQKLESDHFIDSAEDFYQVFNKSSDRWCNWKGYKTSFVFLLCLLFMKGNEIPEVVYRLSAGRFRFNGKPSTTRILKQTFLNIEPLLGVKRSLLPKRIDSVYHIYSFVFL